MNDNQSSSSAAKDENEETILEQIFQLIQLGNDAATTATAASETTTSTRNSGSYCWKAAEYYIHTCELLQQQLIRGKEQQGRDNNDNNYDEKVQRLYQEQIDYYYQKTRSFIIKALQQQQVEQEGDVPELQSATNNMNNTTAMTTFTIEKDEYLYQFHIIHRFYHFLHPVTVPSPSTTTNILCKIHNDKDSHNNHDAQKDFENNQDTETMDDTTTDQLEQRLRQLNANLPTHMKSEEEIIRQRNEQLRRIGVNTISPTTTTMTSTTTTNILTLLETIQNHDDDDPVEAIIAKVTEEVKLLQQPVEEVEKEIMDLKSDIEDDMINALLQEETSNDDDADDDDDDDADDVDDGDENGDDNNDEPDEAQ